MTIHQSPIFRFASEPDCSGGCHFPWDRILGWKPHAGIDRKEFVCDQSLCAAGVANIRRRLSGIAGTRGPHDDQCRHTVADAHHRPHLAHVVFARALAAALPSGVLFWAVLSLFFGVAQYVNTFVAQYEGAAKDRVAASVWQGVYFSLVGGGLLTAFGSLGIPLFRAIGHEGKIAALEGEYFYWLCFGSIPALLTATLSCFFSGRGQTLTVSW